MHSRRIAELLEPFLCPIAESCNSASGRMREEVCVESRNEAATLSSLQLERISTYIDILIRWNARINLTAIRDPEKIVTRHFGESLFVARHLFPRISPVPPESPAVKEVEVNAIRVADLGTGAGFPGLPIKLWAPQIALTLIESNQKKATFLREVTRALTLTDVNIQDVPAETLPPATFETVTIRAVERFSQILPAAAALLARAGRLALLVSSSQLATIHATLPTFSWAAPIPVPQSESRILLVSL